MRYRGLAASAILAVLATWCSAQVDPKEQKAIDEIRSILDYFGETKLSKSLQTDFNSGVVSFADLDPGVSAEAGKPIHKWIDRDPNKLTLAKKQAIQQLVDQKPRKGINGLALSWAVTVKHEYVHLGQINPTLSAKDETPAYLEVSRTLNKWLSQLHRQYMDTLKMPDGPAKTAKLSAIKVLAGEIAIEAGTQNSAVQDGLKGKFWGIVNKPWLTPGKAYAFDMVYKSAFSFRSQVEDSIARSAAKASKAAKQNGKGWRLSTTTTYSQSSQETFDSYAKSHSHRLTLMNTVATSKYSLAGNACSFALTWNSLPSHLPAGKTVKVSLKASDTGCASDKGMISGNVTVYVETSPGVWQMAYGNQECVGVGGKKPSATKEYVVPVPDGKDGQTLQVKIVVADALLSKEFVYIYKYDRGY